MLRCHDYSKASKKGVLSQRLELAMFFNCILNDTIYFDVVQT